MKVGIWAVAAIAVVIALILLFSSQIVGFFSAPPKTIGNFLVANAEVCTELDRTIVYLFGSNSCPHCLWEDPVIKEVTNKFGTLVSFHENIDVDRERDIFKEYSKDGYIPLVVIGCKYYRVGSGETLGKEQESQILTALICSLTNREPAGVCLPVNDLIDQIG
jgi:thiol-disulfide isomerase/thioredoxin